MRITDTSDLWWKNAVVYCLDVKRFADSDGDGWGDFRGLAGKVDYLADLGVTCLWLMPFYPSPMRDDGYDITDYYGIDPRLGTFGDFVEFMRTAHDRGIRVIADLVPNHTSDEHPWFQSARQGPGSPFHDWYVWADERPAESPNDVAFPGEETSIWEYAPECDRYFLHRFYRFQPDLDVSNPAVREEIARIAGFWLELGLSGFRIDAVPALLETDDDAARARMPDPHAFLRHLRGFLGRRSGESMLLGEVNLPHDQQREFFGSGHAAELSTCFDFISMQNLWLSMARQDASPLAHAVEARPAVVAEGQWATFVRNHDELTLDRLTGSERQEVFKAFGPRKKSCRSTTGAAPARPADARRRPGPHPAALQPDVLAPRHAGPLLRRGDRHGREPLGRPAPRRPHADAVERGPQRRLLHRPRGRPRLARREGGLRALGGQRRRPAPRPGLDAHLRALAGARLPGVPGARLGRLHPARLRRSRPSWPTGAAGRTAASSRVHNLADEPVTAHVDPARGRRPGAPGAAAGRRTAGDGQARTLRPSGCPATAGCGCGSPTDRVTLGNRTLRSVDSRSVGVILCVPRCEHGA